MTLTSFRRLCLAGALLALCVVALGAWTRLGNAGLGCPDWPGCYGHLTVGQAVDNADAANAAYPDRPLEPEKALKEMVHRYFAGTLGLVILGVAVFAFANRRDPAQPQRLPGLLVMIVALQALLGMWTVTLLLKPLIVTAHLVGGLTTLSLLWWMSLDARGLPRPESERGLRRFAVAGLVVLVMQILLGGWTSTNYAAVACPDFPTCQASYWPEMDFKDAFVLWRGLGIDYEGGVLDHPARIAIHYTHRLGALATACVLGLLAWRAARRGSSAAVRRAGLAVGAALVAQIVVGPLMVVRGFPLSLATAHNTVAALLLLAVLALLRYLWPPADARA
ncbi:MAG: COX15/CtaA family protein [Steroidobacteraceae bacterium]